jgi:glucose-6-phosphate 1-dehydrogenase
MTSLVVLLLSLLAPARGSHPAASYDIVLVGPTSNLAAKYLWQSLFHLHCESRGALRIHAAGREANATALRARVAALALSNTTCGRPPTRACQEARAAFAAGVAAYSTSLTAQGDEGGLAALGEALAVSARAPGHGGRLLYFAVASEVVPGVLSALAQWVDLSPAGGATRVVVEKPVGSSRASAAALLAALRAPHLPTPPAVLLMDHYLAKSGLLLAAGARWALAQHAPWRAALAAPAVTEAWAMEAEHCGGRAEYYNTAGAVRDMLVTHLTLAAAAALQPPGHSARVTPAARAGVLAALVPTSAATTHLAAAPARLRLGSYAGANASGHALRGAGAVTAAGGVLELRGSGSGSGGSSGSGRVVLWTGKALGLRGGGVRQVLRLGGGEGSPGAAAAAARAACGPLTVTYHLQGQLLPPSPALEALLQGLHRQLQRSASDGASASGAPDYPVLVITGLCGATGVALGDPGALLAQLRRRAARGEGGGAQGWGEESGQWKWEVRSDAGAGVWMGMLVVPPASPEEAVTRWQGQGQGQGGAPGSGSADEAGALEQRLLRLALRPALGGGEAYTSAIASALLGRTEAFLSVEETDRLWAVWDGMGAEADARGSSGSGLEEYAVGEPPAWMRAKEAGRTLGGVAVGSSAGGAGGSGEEL